MNNSRSKLRAACVVFVLGAAAATSANRSDDLTGTEVRVSYAELNLSNQAGLEVLYERLKTASEKVCGLESVDGGFFSHTAKDDRQRCYDDALDAAVARVDDPNLTAMHSS